MHSELGAFLNAINILFIWNLIVMLKSSFTHIHNTLCQKCLNCGLHPPSGGRKNCMGCRRNGKINIQKICLRFAIFYTFCPRAPWFNMYSKISLRSCLFFLYIRNGWDWCEWFKHWYWLTLSGSPTPFLHFTLWCFGRCSQCLKDALMQRPLFLSK